MDPKKTKNFSSPPKHFWNFQCSTERWGKSGVINSSRMNKTYIWSTRPSWKCESGMPWSKDHCVITIHRPLLNVLCRVSLMQPSSLEKDSFPAIKIPPKIWDAYQIIRTTLGHFLASLAGTCSGDIFTFQVSFEVGDLLWALRVWECNIRAIQARRSTDRLRVRTLLQSEVTSWSLLFFLCFLQDTWSAVSTREKHIQPSPRRSFKI